MPVLLSKSIIKLPFSKSIKGKVILRVSGLLTLAMLFITVIVTILMYRQMTGQMEILLQNSAHDAQQRLEHRVRYLIENSEVLAHNELFVNALLDEAGRQTYLQTLAKNFMEGKDVVSLSVVDYDGRPIFQTQEDIPHYDTSPKLRSALELRETSLYLQDTTHHIVVTVPIEYYSTTQGALIVVFDTQAIGKSTVPNDLPSSLRLHTGNQLVYEYPDSRSSDYRYVILEPMSKTPYLSELELALELGLLESAYTAPVTNALIPLLSIGILFILIGLIISVMLANTITQPIVELYRRVTESKGSDYTSCAPLGSDDELEVLAQAFDERSENLRHLAEHDMLTGLPNRLLFLDRLEYALKRAQRNNEIVAVLFLDLDHFKEVNDSLGHKMGDELLKKVASLLLKTLRESDTVARFGGDEYAILIDDIPNETIVIDTINEIMRRFKETMYIEQFRFFVSTSIGIALYPQNGTTTDTLLKNADAAMYKAKEEGRNTYSFYTENMTQQAYERMNLQNQLHSAIQNEEFIVYYQAQVDMRTDTIVGMEALIRWKHPDTGMIPPDKFIPIAEETGLIIDIDRWVMRTAMNQFAAWSKAGYQTGKLSLNLSILQLRHNDFLDVVSTAIAESGINTDQLQFEITETQIMKNPEEAITKLLQLKALGISIAIDDFGTGHSSLSYLKRLPLDKLKIDQSFIQGVPDDHDDKQLTRTIIAMATNLNLELIAEGVETLEQARYLVEHGCNEAQGYLYYRPMHAEALEEALKNKSA